MSGDALRILREELARQNEIPVDLEMTYTVLFSSLQGNLPVNNGIKGILAGLPVQIEMAYTVIPNTMGNQPVNSSLSGWIGDWEIQARMPYKIVFSSISGNIPVNTGLQWRDGGKEYFLRMPYSLVPGTARSGQSLGPGSASGMKAKKVVKPKFLRGKMIIEEVVRTGGDKTKSEAGFPICTGLQGIIDDIEVDLRFHFTYFCDTSSGRNPINSRATGWVRRKNSC